MANRYQYETSPRKLEPDYKTEKKRQNIRVVRDLPKQEVKISKDSLSLISLFSFTPIIGEAII